MSDFFFSSWTDIGRIILVGSLAYIGLVLLLRVSRKRTLSKMNAFDFIVTVALGSTLATILLSKDVSLASGLTALGLLIGLQFAVTWASVRVKGFRKLVTAEASLLAYQGQLQRDFMRKERITESEILAALRESGFSSLDETEAVVLETDGQLSVIGKSESNKDRSTVLDKVHGANRARAS